MIHLVRMPTCVGVLFLDMTERTVSLDWSIDGVAQLPEQFESLAHALVWLSDNNCQLTGDWI